MHKELRIGLIMTELTDSYQNSIFAGIEQEIKRINAKLFCFIGGSLGYNIPTQIHKNSLYSLIDPQNVDVIILMTGALCIVSNLDEVNEMAEKFSPLPVISIALPLNNATNILINSKKSMKEAIEHFIIKHNCKRIAFIKGPDVNEEAQERFSIYKEVLKKHEIPYDENLVCPGNFEMLDGENGVRLLLDERKVSFDALFGVDDIVAMNAMDELKKRNIRIPEDIKIIGFDDIQQSQYYNPALSTIRQPLFEIGCQAAKLAIKKIQKKTLQETYFLDSQFIHRESCACKEGSIELDPGTVTKSDKALSTQDTSKVIIALKKAHFFSEDQYSHSKELINEFSNTIIECILNKTDHNLINFINNKIQNSFDIGFTRTFWIQTFSVIISYLKFRRNIPGENETFIFLEPTFYLTLYKVEANYHAYRELKNIDMASRMRNISDTLINCFNLDRLKEVLTYYLPVFSMETCLFMLFTQDENKAKIVYSYKHPEQENKNVLIRNLAPISLQKNPEPCFFICPLITNQEQLGYTVFGHSGLDNPLYDSLAVKFANSLKAVGLIEKMNNYTERLELEVSERTRELEKTYLKVKELSLHDQLSGLKNRRFLEEVIYPEANQFMNSYLMQQSNEEKRVVQSNNIYAIFMIDIDHFKKINDTYGHKAGDMVLMQISKILKENTRDDDFIVRWGGEEFLIVYRSFSPEYLSIKAEQIRKSVNTFEFVIGDNKTINITCSLGCITYPLVPATDDYIKLETCIALADAGLYYAKNNGRNKSVIVRFRKEIKLTSKMVNLILQDMESAAKQKNILFDVAGERF